MIEESPWKTLLSRSHNLGHVVKSWKVNPYYLKRRDLEKHDVGEEEEKPCEDGNMS